MGTQELLLPDTGTRQAGEPQPGTESGMVKEKMIKLKATGQYYLPVRFLIILTGLIYHRKHKLA
jgi:hypothetical protein